MIKFKKLLIFLIKFFISVSLNAFESDNIGERCLIFLNLFKGGDPTIFSTEAIFLR